MNVNKLSYNELNEGDSFYHANKLYIKISDMYAAEIEGGDVVGKFKDEDLILVKTTPIINNSHCEISSIRFRELNPGECFMFEDKIFIKLRKIRYYMNLENPTDTTTVIPLDSEVIHAPFISLKVG